MGMGLRDGGRVKAMGGGTLGILCGVKRFGRGLGKIDNDVLWKQETRWTFIERKPFLTPYVGVLRLVCV